MLENKTKKSYWDGVWQNKNIPKQINPKVMGCKNYTNRRFHSYFMRIFSSLDTKRLKLLEIGCANSVWLPYFSKEFGFDVTGLDYSEIGCKKSRMNLSINDVNGEVIHADMFLPPLHMFESYDVVVSFGVVEHFEDTSLCIQALTKFLKKDGLLVTNIPNMAGIQGWIQKHINKDVFDIHNPLNREFFLTSNEVKGCEVVECDYFMSTNFGVCNLNGIREGSAIWLFKKIVLAFLHRCSAVVWLIEEKIGVLPEKPLFSPYINCVVKKKASCLSMNIGVRRGG